LSNSETNRDLKATLTGLSDTCEEPPLLCRLSEESSGVDGICHLLLKKKAVSSPGVKTGVIFFLDHY